MSLVGLSQIHIELTSNCSKKTKCSMCAHQSPTLHPNLQLGEMSFDLLHRIRHQIQPPIVVSWHRDGDSCDYTRLGEALQLFRDFPSSVVTHGERLAERAEEIIENCTTVTCSIVPKDPDREIQLASIREFLEKKGDRAPQFQLKFVGDIERPEEYEALGVPIIGRALHSAKGNWSYRRVEPPIPEVRVCMEILTHPCVSWSGKVFACTRYDPNEEGLLGNLNTNTLDEIWNGSLRKGWIQAHLKGRRDLANGLCKRCNYWGYPASTK